MNRDSPNGGHQPNANEPLVQRVDQGGVAYFAIPQGHGVQMFYQNGQQVMMVYPQQQPMMPHQNMSSMMQQPNFLPRQRQRVVTAPPQPLMMLPRVGPVGQQVQQPFYGGHQSSSAPPQQGFAPRQQSTARDGANVSGQHVPQQFYRGRSSNSAPPQRGFDPRQQSNARGGANTSSQQRNAPQGRNWNGNTSGNTSHHQGAAPSPQVRELSPLPGRSCSCGLEHKSTCQRREPINIRDADHGHLTIVPGGIVVINQPVELRSNLGDYEFWADKEHPMLLTFSSLPKNRPSYVEAASDELRAQVARLDLKYVDPFRSRSDDAPSEQMVIQETESSEGPIVQPENTESMQGPVQAQQTQLPTIPEGPAQQQQQSESTAEELSQQLSQSTPVPEDQQPKEQTDVDVNQPTVQEEVVADQEILDKRILEEPVHTTQSTVEDRPLEEQTLLQQPNLEEANQEEVAQDQPNLGEPIPEELPVSPDSTVSSLERKGESGDEEEVEEANGPEPPENVAKVTRAERKAQQQALRSAELAELDVDIAKIKQNDDCDSLFQKYIELNTWVRNSREVYEIQLAGVQLNEFEQSLWEYHYNHYKTKWESKRDSVKSDLTKKKKEACRGTTDESKDMFRKYSVLLMNLNVIVIQDVVAIKEFFPEVWEQKLDKEYLSMVFNKSRDEFDLKNLNKTVEVVGKESDWTPEKMDEKLNLYVQRQSPIRLGNSLDGVHLEHALDEWLNEEFFKMKEDSLNSFLAPRDFYIGADREQLIKDYKSYWNEKNDHLLAIFDENDGCDKYMCRAITVEALFGKDVNALGNEPLLYDTYMLMKLDERACERTANEDPMKHVKNYLHLVFGLPQ